MANLTRKSIMEAFLLLLKKRPLNKIRVSDITEVCGVSRMTFYYHFRDIYDLTDKVIDEYLLADVEKCRSTASWKDAYLSVFTAAQKNRELVLRLVQTQEFTRINRYLNDTAYKYTLQLIESSSSGRKLDSEKIASIAEVYQCAIVGFFTNWVINGMKEDPKRKVEHLATVLSGTVDVALERMIQ